MVPLSLVRQERIEQSSSVAPPFKQSGRNSWRAPGELYLRDYICFNSSESEIESKNCKRASSGAKCYLLCFTLLYFTLNRASRTFSHPFQ